MTPAQRLGRRRRLPRTAAERQVESLRAAIRQHDYRYYVMDRPSISDAAYDRLFARLERLERQHPELVTPDSPTQHVAGAPLQAFGSIAHLAPMLSLASVTDADEVRRFDERVRASARGRAVRYMLEPKFDGLSIEVVYRDGVLLRAATRGDGTRGEDVTSNIKTIRAIPLRLRGHAPPRLLAVRGEAIMHVADFRVLNARLDAEGQARFATPRNAAAGSIRQLDAGVTAGRRLDVVFYDILRVQQGPRLRDDRNVLGALAAWGFRVSPHANRVARLADVYRYHRRMERARGSLPYEIDGIVLKVDDLAQRARLSTTARHPRWALAYKFAPRGATTTILAIVTQVGRTGVLTPVAVLRPVQIGGVTVTRATLHNRDEIRRKDLRVGDRVRVIRAGDVIPEIVSRVRPGGRGGRRRRFVAPPRCPACQTRVVRDGSVDRCPNGLACPAQLKRAIRHVASRQALDIRGLGPATIDALVSRGLLRSVADLFTLTRHDLATIEGLADVSASKLIDAIDKARRPRLSRFIHALGIPGVGSETARVLSGHFGSLDRLASASETSLSGLSGVGPATARRIADFLHRPATRRVIERCRSAGLRIVGH